MADTIKELFDEMSANEHAKHRKAWQTIKDKFSNFWKKFSNPGDVNNPGVFDALNNKFNGNLNFARDKELRRIDQTFSAEQAALAFDRELQASNTAYQRQVADLSKAGFNPALAVGAGGASTPSAYAASSHGPGYTDTTRGFEFLINALIAGASLGIKATASASQIALNEVKGTSLSAGTASQIDLNSKRAIDVMSRANYYGSRAGWYDYMVGDRPAGRYHSYNHSRKSVAPIPKWYEEYRKSIKK